MDDITQFCFGGPGNSLESIFIKVMFFLVPFLLPSQFTNFHIGQGKVEEGQLMVMGSCVNGMANV